MLTNGTKIQKTLQTNGNTIASFARSWASSKLTPDGRGLGAGKPKSIENGSDAGNDGPDLDLASPLSTQNINNLVITAPKFELSGLTLP